MSRCFPVLCLLSLLAPFAAADEAYTLTVKDDRVSLRSANGSLVDVIEELGSLLDFEVYANLRDDVRVDVEFDDLEISDAIREKLTAILDDFVKKFA